MSYCVLHKLIILLILRTKDHRKTTNFKGNSSYLIKNLILGYFMLVKYIKN
jgi:hypothetical protein